MADAAVGSPRVALVLGTSGGGVGRHVRSLAAELVARGHHVVVFGPRETDESFGFSDIAGFRPLDISDRPRPFSDASAVSRLSGMLAGADVVHAHGLRAGGLAALALSGRRRPRLAVTLHNARLAGGVTGAAYGALERIVARKASVVLGVSADLEAAMRRLGARDVRHALVPSPTSAPSGRTRDAVRGELGVADAPVVLAVGRLTEQKGYSLLLDAASRWVGREPQPVVLVAGEGPLHDELARRIAAERLPVRLLGGRGDVPDLMRAADVFVLPSVWEGQPLVAQEALRAGVPIVATAVGGVPEVVGDAAVLVPYGDADGLASAISGLLDEPAERARLGSAALERARGLPDDNAAVDQVEQLYDELGDRG